MPNTKGTTMTTSNTDQTAVTLASTRRTVELAFQPTFKLTPDKREEVKIDLTDVPAACLADILLAGARVILTNAYNSGGKDVAEADRRANVARRVAAWVRGEYALTNTGPRESVYGDMRDAFISKQVSLGKTAKQAEESIRATVTAAFGKDEKATFARFLEAVATIKAKAEDAPSYDDCLKAVTEQAEVAAAQLRKEREEAKAAVEVDLNDLF